ncbi:MAG TPA: hypothetical protein VH107_06275 [Lacipirellulaceae bacterium]|jgi:uncharacterized protein with von Willebrand factor type A (vWA) domain|nr:hypothetical protein [Lacipirellulaceae bacterium]
MANRNTLGGVIHAYQKYDPARFPSPTQPPPDLASAALEHMLMFGEHRELTEEELARAIHLDPSQIAGLGPSIDALIAMLEERKRKILARYETKTVEQRANQAFIDQSTETKVPKKFRKAFYHAVKTEQIRDLERLWYAAGDDQSPWAGSLVNVIERLGEKYEVDELASKYEFTGHEPMSVPQALAIKEELEKIDELLKQLEEARKTARIGIIDMDLLSEFAEPGDVDQLGELQQQVQNYLRQMAEQQGLEQKAGSYRMTPKAMRLFQGKLLERLFRELAPSRTGRHQGPIVGEGAVELQATKDYEFGDSIANLDITGTFINALVRKGPGLPVRFDSSDIQVHRTRNNPKCATCVLMDMSGSMRYDGQYINVKRMGLALEGLISSEYPGDWLRFIEVYSFAKLVEPGRIANLMPKPVTVFNSVVRLSADMSRDDMSEFRIPPHFTNIQHGLSLARRLLASQDTPNKQIILITDGLPTAHFEAQTLYLLYPPDPRTEQATMREGLACQREGITINLFLLPSWSQTEEDVRFAFRLAESTSGRVFFTAGRDLDRYVIWDYLSHRRELVN